MGRITMRIQEFWRIFLSLRHRDNFAWNSINKLCGRLSQYAPPPASWFLTLKVVSESRVTWATSVPILVFLGLSVLDLGPMYAYATDRHVIQMSDAHHRLMPPTLGAGHNNDYNAQEMSCIAGGLSCNECPSRCIIFRLVDILFLLFLSVAICKVV